MNGLRIGGGKCSNASQLVSTSAPSAIGVVVATIWAIAPPVSLPTSTTSSSDSASSSSPTIAAIDSIVRSAPRVIASVCAPSGHVGARQSEALSRGQPLGQRPPQRRAHRVAVDEHHRPAVVRARLLVVDRFPASSVDGGHGDPPSREFTCSLHVRYQQTACNVKPKNPGRKIGSDPEALVGAARRLWGERGYAEVSTPEIAEAAGVTRGAMYHQYADKTALFMAVIEAVEADVIEQLRRDRRRREAQDPGRRPADSPPTRGWKSPANPRSAS